MSGMLKGHEVEILLKAGYAKIAVSRLAGVSLCSVKRIAQERLRRCWARLTLKAFLLWGCQKSAILSVSSLGPLFLPLRYGLSGQTERHLWLAECS